MPKRNLAHPYPFEGEIYGPGRDVDVPDGLAKEIDAEQMAPQQEAPTQPGTARPKRRSQPKRGGED